MTSAEKSEPSNDDESELYEKAGKVTTYFSSFRDHFLCVIKKRCKL